MILEHKFVSFLPFIPYIGSLHRLTVPFWAQAMLMIDRGDADAPTIDKVRTSNA